MSLNLRRCSIRSRLETLISHTSVKTRSLVFGAQLRHTDAGNTALLPTACCRAVWGDRNPIKQSEVAYTARRHSNNARSDLTFRSR